MTKKDFINIAKVLRDQWHDAHILDDNYSLVLQASARASLESFCRMLKENYTNFNEERFRAYVTQ